MEGIVFLIASLIGATGLGDGIWYFIPWAWPVRWGALIGRFIPEFLKLNNASMIFAKEYFIKEISMSVIFSGICFLLIRFWGVIWFKKWEGKKIS